jgi:glycosyltransferase involved in cell wall biosynthesis
MRRVDVLVLSLGTTAGWRLADAELAGSFERAGARVALARVPPAREVRTFALTDAVQAAAARRAARAALTAHRPRALVYCTVTAALLWPEPGAIRFDSPAAANRPGRHGVWQRPLERRRLAAAPLLMPMDPAGLAEARQSAARAVLVRMPVEPSGPPAPARDLAAVLHAANPEKKGLDRMLGAWAGARRPGETLVVAGTNRPVRADGVVAAGIVPPDDYRALLRRARVFLAAPRREDYGIAPLEALADGCLLVTTPAAGPYAALPLARTLDPRLVDEDLATALRTALDDPAPDYAERAAALLAPFRRAAVDRVVAGEALPRLLDGR